MLNSYKWVVEMLQAKTVRVSVFITGDVKEDTDRMEKQKNSTICSSSYAQLI